MTHVGKDTSSHAFLVINYCLIVILINYCSFIINKAVGVVLPRALSWQI